MEIKQLFHAIDLRYYGAPDEAGRLEAKALEVYAMLTLAKNMVTYAHRATERTMRKNFNLLKSVFIASSAEILGLSSYISFVGKPFFKILCFSLAVISVFFVFHGLKTIRHKLMFYFLTSSFLSAYFQIFSIFHFRGYYKTINWDISLLPFEIFCNIVLIFCLNFLLLLFLEMFWKAVSSCRSRFVKKQDSHL